MDILDVKNAVDLSGMPQELKEEIIKKISEDEIYADYISLKRGGG